MEEGGRREAVLRAYDGLRLTHPELPNQLRDFQVAFASFWRSLWLVTIYDFAGRHFMQSAGQGGGGAHDVCPPHWLRKKPTDAIRNDRCSFLVYLCQKVEPDDLVRRRYDMRALTTFCLTLQAQQSSSWCPSTPSSLNWF